MRSRPNRKEPLPPSGALRIFFGESPLAIATRGYESRLATWRAWEPMSIAAHGKAD